MSRYLVLVVLNLPLVLAGFLGSLIDYKTHKISRGKYAFLTTIWLVILTGLLASQPVLDFLYRHHLTHKDTMSLVDVVEITGIVYLFFIGNRWRIKMDTMERQLYDFHQELSIRLSESKTDGKTRK